MTAAPHDHDDHDHGHDHGRDHGDGARPRGGDAARGAHRGGHGHDHHQHLGDAPARKLAIALGMTLVFCGIEAAAGWAFHSLALLADAGHMLSDSAALLLAWIAQRIARRERTRHRTFGYRRAEVLAAFVNGVALGGASLVIVIEAARRWHDPPAIQGLGVLITASIGLAVNIAAALVLSQGEGHNANTRAALTHVAADAIGSVGAIAAALLVMFVGWRRADPAISAFIAVLLAYGAWKLVQRTTVVLMEGVPSSVTLRELEALVRETPGVLDAHDFHAWTISDGFDAVSVHVVLAEGHHGTDVAEHVAHRIREAFGITHVTVQPERKPHSLLPVDRLMRRDP